MTGKSSGGDHPWYPVCHNLWSWCFRTDDMSRTSWTEGTSPILDHGRVVKASPSHWHCRTSWPTTWPSLHIGLARQHRIFLTNHSKTAVLYIEIAALSPWCREVSPFWNWSIKGWLIKNVTCSKFKSVIYSEPNVLGQPPRTFGSCIMPLLNFEQVTFFLKHPLAVKVKPYKFDIDNVIIIVKY